MCILGEEDPSSLGDSGQKLGVLDVAGEVVVVDFDGPARRTQCSWDSATEIAVAEED